MFTASTCLICDHKLLRHARAGGEIYWFCSHCWQEMPVLYKPEPIFVSFKAKGLNQIKVFSWNKILN